jgi:DNA repair exonuclease SbcCD ATPase subunit
VQRTITNNAQQCTILSICDAMTSLQESLTAALQEANDRITQLQSTHRHSNSKHSSLHNSDAQVAGLAQQNDSLTADNKSLQREVTRLRQRLTQRTELGQDSGDSSSGSGSNSQKENDEHSGVATNATTAAKPTLAELRKTVQLYHKQFASMTEASEKLQAEATRLRNERNTALARLQAVKSAAKEDTAAAVAAALAAAAAEQQQQQQQLEQAVQEARAGAAVLFVENAKLKADVAELTTRVQSSDETVVAKTQLQQQLEQATTTIATLQAAFASAEKQTAAAVEAAESASTKHAAITAQLTDQITGLQEENDRLAQDAGQLAGEVNVCVTVCIL